MEKALANKFIQLLNDALEPEQISTINERNKKYFSCGDTDICATHEFCDPNQYMLDAFSAIIGREPVFGTENDNGSDLRLMNNAWLLAKDNEFRKIAQD